MYKRLFLFAALALMGAVAHADYDYDETPVVSTAPIGSSYYRHLAHMTNIDLRELEKFEQRGFGRTEINILILISSGSVQTLKDYGNRRLKDNVPLNDLIAEAHCDHDAIYAKARAMKAAIEAMGDQNLPPPVYELGVTTTTVKAKPITGKKAKEDPIDAKPVAPKPD
jgi:hypothetical protein